MQVPHACIHAVWLRPMINNAHQQRAMLVALFYTCASVSDWWPTRVEPWYAWKGWMVQSPPVCVCGYASWNNNITDTILTDIRHILFSEKFGIMVISSFSAKNSTSKGSIPYHLRRDFQRNTEFSNFRFGHPELSARGLVYRGGTVRYYCVAVDGATQHV